MTFSWVVASPFPNYQCRFDAEGHRSVKFGQTKSHQCAAAVGQPLNSYMYGHIRLERLTLKREKDRKNNFLYTFVSSTKCY